MKYALKIGYRHIDGSSLVVTVKIDIVVLPKSVTPSRILQNAQVNLFLLKILIEKD